VNVDALGAVGARLEELRERLAQVTAPPFPTLPSDPAAPVDAAPAAPAGTPAAPHTGCASCRPGASGTAVGAAGAEVTPAAVRASYSAAAGLGGTAAPDGLLPASTGPAGAWAARLPEAGRRWAGAIEAAATKAGVDPRLLASLAWQESAFKPDARSGAGAIGLTQLMPGTARGLGVNPHDPVANLEGGARYLRAQLDRVGSVDLALAAYNAGPARVARTGAVPNITQTRDYVQRVTANYARLQ